MRASIFLLLTWTAACAHGDRANPGATPASSSPPVSSPAAIVAKSDAFARRLIDVDAQFAPESLEELGDAQIDERVADMGPGRDERALKAYTDLELAYKEAAAAERTPVLRTDLELLARAAHDRARQVALDTKYTVPFHELAGLVHDSLTPLLKPGVAPDRKRAALVRLRAYAGASSGRAPITELAERATRERLDRPGLLFPPKTRVDRYLKGSAPLIGALREAFEKAGIPGYEEPLARLETQMRAYDAFVRTIVLPRARDGFRRPEELYAFDLERRGIDAKPRELAAKGRRAFVEIQRAMDALAPEVARQKGYASSDYRSVIRALKREPISGEALVARYRKRIEQLEAIIRNEHLATLPKQPLRFRMASAAESIQIPAPYYQPASFSDRKAAGEFVLPVQPGDGSAGRFNDFDFDAATWWLAAHEGRPGHDLQYARLLEHGVSIARGIFGFNSANAEGWGLYAESMVEPYLPPEGRLACLQARLMRAAHVFLDIELNLGLIDEAEVRRVMTEDVVFSEAWANQVVQRYTFWLPGQAPTYFYGYVQLLELRAEVERKLGARFDARKFHDCVLEQGMVRMNVLRHAVLDIGCS